MATFLPKFSPNPVIPMDICGIPRLVYTFRIPNFAASFALKFRESRPSNEANPESRETSWGPSNEDIILLDGAFRTTHQSLKSGGAGGLA